MLPVESPFKTYTGLDGKPLNDGYVYFGQPNQDPIMHPVTVYWDAAGTLPAAQPLRTVNGYIMNAGTPANVFFDNTYSELVQDSKLRQVFYAPSSDDFSIATLVLGLANAAGSSKIGFMQGGLGAQLRTVQAKLRDIVSLADFAPIGDGATNDTATVMAADAYAASRGAPLYVPKPAVAYFGNGFRPTTDWICEPGTVFLNSNRAAFGGDAYLFFVVEHDVTVVNATADANRINTVTGTPDIAAGSWSAANFDKFTGGIAIVIQSGAKPTMINCTGRNSGGHPAWHITNSSPKLYRCKANGARGNFGDGFYMGACSNAVLEDCASDDVTRINFCSEDKSAGIKLVRPVATNAHDAGTLYGGTEFNASIWMEHTVGSAIEDPDCDNAFTIGGAGKWLGDPRAVEPINLRGGRTASMNFSSLDTDLFDVNVMGHKSGQLTYSLRGAQAATLNGCRLITGGPGTANLNGTIRCDGEVAPSRLRVLNSTLQVSYPIDTGAHGHIAFNTKTPHLTVEHTKGYDAAGNEVPLTLGFTSVSNANTTGSMKFRDVDISLWGNFPCGSITFDGKYTLTCDNNVNMLSPVYFGPNGAIKTNVVANSPRLFVYKDITVRGKIQNVRLRMVGDAAKSNADFRNASFEFDMSVFQPAVLFQETNWNAINFAGATFRHTGAAGPLADNYWIESDAAAGISLPFLAGNTFASNTVTNILKHGTVFEDPGFTKAPI